MNVALISFVYNCTPNIGAYQGHGDLVFVATVSVDTVSGVALYRYPFIGR